MECFEASRGAKRRRLTRRAMPADGVKVKDESSAEGEVDPQRPENEMSSMEMDDLWTQLARQTADMENHIRRLARCDKQEIVTAEEPAAESVKATNETGAEQGMMPSPAAGSHAVQGLEVFESVGVPNEEAPRDEKAKEVLVAAAAEHPLPLGVEQKPFELRRYSCPLTKQSRVPNISWNCTNFAWQVNFPKLDSRGKFISSTSRDFAVKNFMVQGRSEAEADAEALEAAKTFRAELVEKGILRELTLKDPEFTSKVLGVSWSKSRKKWNVEVTLNKRNRIYGGSFTEKAAAEAKALELCEKHGLQLQVQRRRRKERD